MERAEAQAIYERGREVVVVLLRMDEQIARLESACLRRSGASLELEHAAPSSTASPASAANRERGERRIERLLSAHTTCRLQRRSLHAYLIDAIAAQTRGDPAPLLA